MLRNYFFGHFSSRLESEVCRDIKGRLVRKLSVTKLVEIERVSMGQLLSRYNEDVEKVSKFVLTGFQTLFFSPFMSVCGFLYLFHYSWKLSVGVFLPIPLFALILNFYSKRAGGIYEDGCKIKSGYVGSVYEDRKSTRLNSSHNTRNGDNNRETDERQDAKKTERNHRKNL